MRISDWSSDVCSSDLVVESTHSIRYSAKPGDIKLLHSSSIGKTMLGCMKDPELRAWLQARPLDGVTPATLTDPAALLADVQQGRRLGYFQTRGENVDDGWAVAASLVDRKSARLHTSHYC